MKKIKFLGTAILAASLLLAGCSSPVDDVVEDDDTTVTLSPEDDGTTSGGGTTTGGNPSGGGSTSGGSNEPVINYTAPDLSSYYKRYLVSSPSQTTNVAVADWGAGCTTTSNADGTYTIASSGSMWGGVGGICAPFTNFDEGTFDNYEYIVFTVDTTDYVIDYTKNEGNYGVNVKIAKGEPIGSQQNFNGNCVVNGNVRTYYAPISSFTDTVPPVATEMAILIGGQGSIKLNEVYLAAANDPSSVPVTGITASFDNFTEGFSGETITITVKDSNHADITSEATFTIDANNPTGSSISGNQLTTGATPGTVRVNVEWENFTTTAEFVILEPYAEKVLYDPSQDINELNFGAIQGWWGTYTVTAEDSAIDTTGMTNGCYGIQLNEGLSYKTGAKLEIHYTANNAFAVKPVSPDAEFMVDASESETTKLIELGDRAKLDTIGIVFKADNSSAAISYIKLINEEAAN